MQDNDLVHDTGLLPQGFNSKMKLPEDLFEYQREDLTRLLNSSEGFLNLSEMGTGKTPVAIGLAKLGDFKKTLIVCPKTLRWEWSRQIQDWYGIEPTVGKGSFHRLDELADQYEGNSPDNPFFIVNYETFRKEDHRMLLNIIHFDLVILDEAHRVRNPETSMFRGLSETLSKYSGAKVLAMTGSPVVNKPDDLYSLLCLTRPEQFPRKERNSFILEYCYTIARRNRFKVIGVRKKEQLQAMIKSFSIQRRKKEVLPFLPDKYYRIVNLEMSEDQKKIYDKARDQLMIELDNGETIRSAGILALLIRLRQLSLDPRILGLSKTPSIKSEFLRELIEDLGDEKLVVFSTFADYIDILESDFKDIPHITITGKTPSEQRMANVKRFQEDENCRLAFGTMQTMGEGITLTAASNVVLMDRWWSPTVNEQAIDRTHRIGQTNKVQVILPVAKDSIDQSMDKILQGKNQFVKDVLGTGNDYEVMEAVLDDIKDSFRSNRHAWEREF